MKLVIYIITYYYYYYIILDIKFGNLMTAAEEQLAS